MATNENLIPIPGRLHSVASNKTVSGADEIYDDELQIFLNDINKDINLTKTKVTEIERIIGSEDASEDTIINRINNLELSVGEGGSVDQKILDAVAAEKNRAQDIEGGLQTQVNGKQRTLSVGSGITLTSDGVISATADPSVGKVVESLPLTDIIDGMIYLVQKANTPGTYVQWVHYGNDWTNKGEISLGITTDDTLDSTSSNPIQNAAIAAQIGYFVCGNGYASSEIKDVDALGFKLPDVGGDFKIKMNEANTHAGPVYLRFNSSNDTKAELKYNRESVSPTNTWEAEEVISVYYDGTYYQASNAQGGGANSGIKKLPATSTGRAVYYDALTTSSKITGFSYVKQSVKEGDVFKITASVYSYTSSTKARLWILANSSNEVIVMAGTRASAKDLILVIPEGVDYVVFNNYATDVAEPEWYYAKAGSPAAYELINSSYMYGERRLLTVGENYEEGEEVRSRYGEMLKINAHITSMNLTDTLAVLDKKTYEGNTYNVNKAVDVFINTGTYTSGDYAIGSCTEGTISITGESITAGTIDVTINGETHTLDISDGNTVAEIAAMIISNFPTVVGWTLTNNNDGTISVICNTGGINSLSFSAVATDTNVSVSYTETVGINTIRKYNGETWTTIESEEELIEDTALYSVLDEAYLIYNFTKKDSLPKRILTRDSIEDVPFATLHNVGTSGELYYINDATLKWVKANNSTYKNRCVLLDVRECKGKIVTVTTDSSIAFYCAALNTNSHAAGSTPSFTQNYLVYLAPSNPTTEFYIDDDTNYIYIPTQSKGGTAINSVITVKELPTYNDVYDTVETVKLIDDKTVYDMTAIEVVASYINTNNVWATGNDNSCFFLDVSEHQGGYLYVNNSKSSATMTFLKDDSHTTGMAPAFCEGESVKLVGTGRNLKFAIPGDANFVWFRYYINNSSSYVNPESVIAIGKGSAGGGNGSAFTSSLDLIYQNMQKKVLQMTDIKWTALKKISTKPSAGTHTGLPYASTQKHSKTIGEDVSLKTFMTAANNPYSLLYSEDLRDQTSEYGFIYGSPGATTFGYMGVVCSSFTGLACGIDQWTTKFMDYLARDGVFTKIQDQSAKGLKVGDWIWEDGHVRIVFEVSKINGAISSITLAEATSSDGALTRRMTYSEVGLDSDMQNKGCIIYRYNEMYKNVTYEPSEFVKAASDEPDIVPYQYNNDICTYQGDYACFRTGWPVWLNYNLKSVGTWTSIQLYKGNTLVNTYTIDTSIHKIQIPAADIATYGMYKARITDGTNYSDYTYFEVVDVNVACERVSGNTFKISYSSANATPVRINIGGFGGSAVCVRMLTSQEKADGYVVINPVDWIALQLKASRSSLIGNSYYIRVFFKGEYGRVTNFLPEDDNDINNPVGLVKIDLISE